MKKSEIYEIGFRLIGVYFSVLAFTTIFITIVSIISSNITNNINGSLYLGASFISVLISSMQPIGYLIAAYFLIIKTDWCIEKLNSLIEKSNKEQAH